MDPYVLPHGLGGPRYLVPVLPYETQKPEVELLLEHAYVLDRVVATRSDWLTVVVGRPGCVGDYYKGVCPPHLVQELVPQALPTVGSSYEARAVYDVDGDEADAVYAGRVDWVVLDPELLADAGRSDVSHSPIGLDGGEWETCYLYGLHGGGSEEGALTDVRLTNESDESSQSGTCQNKVGRDLNSCPDRLTALATNLDLEN